MSAGRLKLITVRTPGISRPRPARSVATRKSTSPSRKASSASPRCCCVRLPWSSATRREKRPKRRRTRCACFLDEVKTMARSLTVRVTRESNTASRSCSLPALMRTNSCASFSATLKTGSTLTCIGLLSDAPASSETPSEMVAEKSSVCRDAGQLLTTSSTSSLKPSSRRRSASSSTKISTSSSPMEAELRRRSMSLPGVATTTSGLERSSTSCTDDESPPTIRLNRTSECLASRSPIVTHCAASSRVGARTSTRVAAMRRGR
mmetsp:Transcript_22731/g.49024  ORF Transcript_22731/g.49024 Transcript_22731/m.49024 type:complete len:263 (-) Transcript_22731:683-1471(-)